MRRQGLVCSCASEPSGASRKSTKCECAFDIVIFQVLGPDEDNVKVHEVGIEHNHGPIAARYIGDNLELDLPQRLLNAEETQVIGTGLLAGNSVEVASKQMAAMVKRRYYDLFSEFGDEEAKLLVQV